jgi:putative Ca2+/H+ antiporter (TMEM165/GDT1 family)
MQQVGSSLKFPRAYCSTRSQHCSFRQSKRIYVPQASYGTDQRDEAVSHLILNVATRSTGQSSTTDKPESSLLTSTISTKDVSSPLQNATFGAVGAIALALLTPLGANAVTELLASPAAFFPGLVGDSPLREGFVSAFLLIFFSEIGDKTFFIAVLLALQQPRGLVFTGTFGALAVMTVISVGLGRVLHEIDEFLPNLGFPLDDVLAVLLLVFFGIQTLRSAATADDTAAEEREEAKEVVEGLGGAGAALGMIATTFALVFAAEWGDKSFLATIALAAASDPLGVVLGAVVGHGVATVIAVLGGSFLGNYMDEKTVQYVGGSLFLVFAAATIYDIVAGVAPV